MLNTLSGDVQQALQSLSTGLTNLTSTEPKARATSTTVPANAATKPAPTPAAAAAAASDPSLLTNSPLLVLLPELASLNVTALPTTLSGLSAFLDAPSTLEALSRLSNVTTAPVGAPDPAAAAKKAAILASMPADLKANVAAGMPNATTAAVPPPPSKPDLRTKKPLSHSPTAAVPKGSSTAPASLFTINVTSGPASSVTLPTLPPLPDFQALSSLLNPNLLNSTVPSLPPLPELPVFPGEQLSQGSPPQVKSSAPAPSISPLPATDVLPSSTVYPTVVVPVPHNIAIPATSTPPVPATDVLTSSTVYPTAVVPVPHFIEIPATPMALGTSRSPMPTALPTYGSRPSDALSALGMYGTAARDALDMYGSLARDALGSYGSVPRTALPAYGAPQVG